MTRNQVLVSAINDSLLSLGEPIMRTIVWHLNARGVYLDERRGVDIRLFYSHLEYIIGDITGVVLGEIYERLKNDIERLPPPPPNNDNDDAITVDMIEQLLQIHPGGSHAQ
jgi:hypothetical protein